VDGYINDTNGSAGLRSLPRCIAARCQHVLVSLADYTRASLVLENEITGLLAALRFCWTLAQEFPSKIDPLVASALRRCHPPG